MKMDIYFSGICLLVLALNTVGCNGSNSGAEAGKVRSNGVVLTAFLAEGKYVVRVDNNSSATVFIADEPLIGFGLDKPRIGLVMRRDGKDIIPCTQVGMPKNENAPIQLMPNQSKEREVSLEIIRRVYCLESGRYSLRAVYPYSSPSPSVSDEVFIEVEGA